MFLKKLFPCSLAACLAFAMLAISAAAQSVDDPSRQVAQTTDNHTLSIPNDDAVIISLASAEDLKAANPFGARNEVNFRFQQLMAAAIDQRLGARYSWGATGPSAFDCSGFVWSTFKSAGIDFERGNTRELWNRFSAPAQGDQYKFGTLVFFSGRAHVGIVADEYGFYHASRHHGVVYSPFNDYWTSRIDGFRQVPLQPQQSAD